jgi:hemerythrin
MKSLPVLHSPRVRPLAGRETGKAGALVTQNEPQNEPWRLRWSERFEVGVESLDADHRELVRLIDAACCAAHDGERSRFLELLDRVQSFAVEHFAREEAILESIPGGVGDVESHAMGHRRSVERLSGLRQNLNVLEDLGDVRRLCADLIDWFVKHAVGFDSHIRGYFYDGR